MGKLLRFSSLLGMLVFIFMGNVFSQEEKKYVLVSDIDFRVPNAELLPYPLESINPSGYEGGVIKPQVTIGDTFQFFRSGASGLDSSLFLSTPSYAIVQNPIALDSFRMIDNNEMNGIVFSSGSEGFKGAGPEILSFEIAGLKFGCGYRIEVEWGNPHSKSYLSYSSSDGMPHLSSGVYSPHLNLVLEPWRNYSLFGSVGKSGAIQKSTYEYSNGIGVGEKLKFSIKLNNLVGNTAVIIKRVAVYAEIAPKIRAKEAEVCVGGETTQIMMEDEFNLKDIQWFKDGERIEDSNGLVTHISNDSISANEYYYVGISPHGDSVISSKCVVRNVACGMDESGSLLSRELVWQEDFGTFTSANDYWVWDYSDINNPKKVHFSDGEKWTMCPKDSSIYGGECELSPNLEAKYSIAANVTCVWNDLSGGDGTQWEWESYFGDMEQPVENGWMFVPDHTYDGFEYGGMLFMNYGGEANEPIYKKDIYGLCPERTYQAKCYLNIFGSVMYPGVIQIRLIDLTTNDTVLSNPLQKDYEKDYVEWVETSCSIQMKGTALRLEIVSLEGGTQYNHDGNCFVIDDIQLWTSALPKPHIKYSSGGQSILMEGDPLFENYWQDDYVVLYQYSMKSDSHDIWQNFEEKTSVFDSVGNVVGGILKELSVEGLKDTTIDVSVRAVIGERKLLEDKDLFYANSSCGEYAVSNIVTVPIHVAVTDSFASVVTEGNKMTIRWTKVPDTDGYVLMVFEDESMTDSICVAKFDKDGELLSYTGLRGLYGSGMMTYTLSDLPVGDYYYSMVAKKDSVVLKRSLGDFVISQTTSILTPLKEGSDVVVYVQNGILYVETLSDGDLLVMDVLGGVKKRLSLTSGELAEIMLPHGVYLVKFDNETYKVVIY